MQQFIRTSSLGLLLAFSAGASHAQTPQQATVIENVVALQVAQSTCGYTVNFDMLGIVLSSVNLHTEDLSRAGKYWSSVERNQARVRRLIATDAGKASFCRSVRRDLSAMFE